MSRTEEIIKGLTSAMSGADRKKQSSYDTPATVTRIEGNTAWVHINGGISETPVKLTINAKIGDTVQVRVGGGTAWLVGNQTAPPTDDTKAVEAKEEAVRAGKTATDFVADTDNGLFVHPRDNMDDGVRVKDVIEILRGGKTVAVYGDTVRVGEVGKGHVVIDGENFYLYTEEDIESARIGIEEGSTLNVFGTGNSVQLDDEAEAVVTVAGINNNVVDGLATVEVMGHDNTVENNGCVIGSYNELHGSGTEIGNYLYYDADTGGSGTAIQPPAWGNALVIGCYNRKTADQGDYAFIIGNGSGENYRKDAFKVDWNGGLYSDNRKLFAKDTATGTVTVNRLAANSVTIPITKTGYTPWAITGIDISSASCNIYKYYINGNNLIVNLFNTGTSSASSIDVTVTARIAYIATSAL